MQGAECHHRLLPPQRLLHIPAISSADAYWPGSPGVGESYGGLWYDRYVFLPFLKLVYTHKTINFGLHFGHMYLVQTCTRFYFVWIPHKNPNILSQLDYGIPKWGMIWGCFSSLCFNVLFCHGTTPIHCNFLSWHRAGGRRHPSGACHLHPVCRLRQLRAAPFAQHSEAGRKEACVTARFPHTCATFAGQCATEGDLHSGIGYLKLIQKLYCDQLTSITTWLLCFTANHKLIKN